MSPIGRVFLVLNLALAGLFVGFAGSYLQKDANYKKQFTELEASSKREVAGLNDTLKGVNTELTTSERSLSLVTQQLKAEQGKTARLTQENEAKEQRLAEMETTLSTMNSAVARLDTAVKAYNANNETFMNKAIAAEKARDAAVTAQNAAVKGLADANQTIAGLQKKIGGQAASIAELSQNLKEHQTLVALVKQEMPNFFTNHHPLVTGTVGHVSASGKLLTISLKSGAENLKPGATFAVYNGSGYKGEARVTDVDKSRNFCFARLEGEGKVVAGDSASTNLSRSGN